MLRLRAAAVGLAFLLTGGAEAAGPPIDAESATGDPLRAYEPYGWTDPRDIPDGDRHGILIGPVLTSDRQGDMGSVILRLAILHPRPGDLDIWLAYDADGDSKPEVRVPIEYCHSRPDAWAKELHGLPVWLEGTYYFRDGPDSQESVFAPLHRLPQGHAFYLAVADTLPMDLGTVVSWAVYTEEPTRR